MSVTVSIDGLEEVKKALSVLPARIQKNILVSGVRAVASTFQKEAKRIVPKDEGDLKNSIKTVKRRTKDGSTKFSVGINSKTANVYYGHMIEFGTKKATAQPFMRPAYEQNKSKAVQSIVTKMRARLDKEIEKARVK